MPLNTQVLRDGKPVKGLPWTGMEGETMLNIFLTVGLTEGDPELVIAADGRKAGEINAPEFVNIAWTGVYYVNTKAPLWKKGRQVLTRDYTYDLDPKLKIELKKGDVLEMWRSYS